MNIDRPSWIVMIILMIGPIMVRAEEFFVIREIKVHEKPEMVAGPQGKKVPDPMGIWVKTPLPAVGGRRAAFTNLFIPSLEVIVETRLQTRAKDTFARVYFYSAERKHLGAAVKPSVAQRPERADFAMPIFFGAKKSESLFFAIPREVSGNWTAIAVFGDAREATAKATGRVFWADYDFPEKELVLGGAKKDVEREEAEDSVIELPVQTGNSKQPLITMFLRFPSKPKRAHEEAEGAGTKSADVGFVGGPRDASRCEGVLAKRENTQEQNE